MLKRPKKERFKWMKGVTKEIEHFDVRKVWKELK